MAQVEEFRPAPPQIRERKKTDKVTTTAVLTGEEARRMVEELLVRFPRSTAKSIFSEALKSYYNFHIGNGKNPPMLPRMTAKS